MCCGSPSDRMVLILFSTLTNSICWTYWDFLPGNLEFFLCNVSLLGEVCSLFECTSLDGRLVVEAAELGRLRDRFEATLGGLAVVPRNYISSYLN